MNKQIFTFAILVMQFFALTILTSCATPMQTEEREQAINKAVNESVDAPEVWSAEVAKHVDVPTRWLQSFNDPELLKLIDEGKKNNIDLQMAAANMDKAWLLAKQSGAALKPTVDLSLDRNQSGSAEGGA